MDFDSRRECRDKRLHVGKSEFQQALLNEWGLEGGQDFVSANSVVNNVRRAFWVRVQCSLFFICFINSNINEVGISFLSNNFRKP